MDNELPEESQKAIESISHQLFNLIEIISFKKIRDWFEFVQILNPETNSMTYEAYKNHKVFTEKEQLVKHSSFPSIKSLFFQNENIDIYDFNIKNISPQNLNNITRSVMRGKDIQEAREQAKIVRKLLRNSNTSESTTKNIFVDIVKLIADIHFLNIIENTEFESVKEFTPKMYEYTLSKDSKVNKSFNISNFTYIDMNRSGEFYWKEKSAMLGKILHKSDLLKDFISNTDKAKHIIETGILNNVQKPFDKDNLRCSIRDGEGAMIEEAIFIKADSELKSVYNYLTNREYEEGIFI